jgi:hypothetical protein
MQVICDEGGQISREFYQCFLLIRGRGKSEVASARNKIAD